MGNLILPGLIDMHVHLRTPGQTHKEDFYTGTLAALAGGFTAVFDMPNNKEPITTQEKLEEKIRFAKEKTVCDLGFYFGSLGDNFKEFEKAAKKAMGLKLYLNPTTGNYLINEKKLKDIFIHWKSAKPILFHSEEESIDGALKAIKITRKRTHICHISSKYELEKIIAAKEKGLPVTCGVTPHHLFLTKNDVKTLKRFGMMKPPLRSKKDQEFLWKNLKYIDVIESDHAPHTIEEKKSGKTPFGVPGLETTLPLLLTAAHQNRITFEQIIKMCFEEPLKILHLKPEKHTKIEIDLQKEYIIKGRDLFTKCGWTPFEGWKVRGKLRKVFLRGKNVFEDGKILAKPGSGRILPT